MAEKMRASRETLKNIYDTSSGGLGIHVYAVRELTAGKITNRVKTVLNHPYSNFLGNPLMGTWTDPDCANAPYNEVVYRTPREDDHQRLIRTMRKEYLQLNHRQLRAVLTGDVELEREDAQIQAGEMDRLLQQAARRGILPLNPDVLTGIKPTGSWVEIVLQLIIEKRARIPKEVAKSMATLADEVSFSPPFRDSLKLAATHKLGSLMAATDQLTFDLAGQRKAVRAKYKPTGFRESWQRQFGESVPNLEALYKMAHSALVQIASPDDPLLQHLFALPELPQLAK